MAKRKSSVADVISGTDGNDLLNGTAGDDGIQGGGGNDTIYGLGGNDKLFGQDDDDVLYGGEGKDTLQGNGGNDTLDGGVGADRMEGGNKSDVYYVDNVGDKVIEEGNQSTGGEDHIYSSISFTISKNVEVLTLTGNTNINATGSAQNDYLIGNAGNNVIKGVGGYDHLRGEGGNDDLDGGAAGDWIEGGTGADVVKGGNGDDLLGGHYAEYEYFWPVPDDNAADLVDGGAGNDYIFGSGGADTLIGGKGDDIYRLVNDVDVTLVELNGGGDDTVWVTNQSWTLGQYFENMEVTNSNTADPGAVYVGTGNAGANFMTATAEVGDVELYGMGGNDTLSGGSAREDVLLDGGDGNDEIYDAVGGDDTLIGGAGNDTLTFGIGNDVVTGGSGNDSFVMRGFPEQILGPGTITDFNGDQDTLRIDNTGLAGMETFVGTLSAAAFVAGSAATDAAHRFVYDASAGALYYDSDGSGANAQILLLDLTVAAGQFNNQDIQIISF